MEIASVSKIQTPSVEKARDIFNAVPSLIAHANTALQYTYANHAFSTFHKLPAEEIIGKSVHEVLGTEIFKATELFIQDALKGITGTFRDNILLPGGECFLEISYVPEFNAQHEITGYWEFATHLPDKTTEILRQLHTLQKNEAQYRGMVQEVEDYAIILLDKHGNVQSWNKGAEKIKGYTKDEIAGRNFRIFYSAEDRDKQLPDSLLKLAADKGKATHQGWQVKKDGSRFWGAVVITALHDTEGSLIGFSKLTRDRTIEKQSEEKQYRYTLELQEKNELLKQNEERYHKMIAEVEDYAIILLDKEGYIRQWNKGAEKIKGYSIDEISGKNFRIFYSIEDREKLLPDQLIAEAEKKGKATHEGWRIRKDGTRFWGLIVITALHDDKNNVIGFSKVTRDLTEKKAYEEKQQRFTAELQLKNEELRRSEERYHKMIAEVADYAIILLDPEGTILNWNKGAERIKGYTAAEIIGRNISVFYSQDDKDAKLPEKLIQYARDHGAAHHEGFRIRKNGTRFWGSVVITALHDADNKIIGFSKVTRDLTERKLAEDKLKQNAEQLEMQNKELEQFAYVASHDLQEPLRKIRTFNSLILEQEAHQLSERARDYFERTISAANRMQQLIEDLLTYSRATRDADKKEPVDLNLIAERICASYKESDKKVSIIHDNLPVLQGMPFQFEQLFNNLISNGVKYQTPHNTPQIHIRYRVVYGDEIKGKGLGASSRFHELKFTDNGIGFDPEYAEKIFEMFQRLHGRSEYTGSGIGLAIVKKIAQNYNGFVMAESVPGKGAAFTVYFPLET